MKRSLIAVALSAAATGCGSHAGPPIGVAHMSLASVPANVQCIALSAAGAQEVDRLFPVTPSQPSTLQFEHLPTGSVTFTGQAYDSTCPAIGSAAPTWKSDPVTATLAPNVPTDVHLVFYPTGEGNISIDFDGGTPPPITTPPQCTPPGSWSATRKMVASQVHLPMWSHDLAFDLNGDAKPDNQYALLTSALLSQQLPSQPTMDAAVTAGDALLLVTRASNDASFSDDACAAVQLGAAVKPAAPPKLNGSDQLTVDSGVAPSQLLGPLANGLFISANPAALDASPPPVTVKLPFTKAMVSVPLYGARVMVAANGSGQLNGAIKSSDMQSIVVPGIASGLTAFIAADPSSQDAKQLALVFDNGGFQSNSTCDANACRDVDGRCATPKDGVITPCEVGSSSLIVNLLVPDVEMFAADGSYHPNQANTNKNAYSVGIGFDLVKASY